MSTINRSSSSPQLIQNPLPANARFSNNRFHKEIPVSTDPEKVLKSFARAVAKTRLTLLEISASSNVDFDPMLENAMKNMAHEASMRMEALISKYPSSVPDDIKNTYKNTMKSPERPHFERACELLYYLDLRDNLLFLQAMGANVQLGETPTVDELKVAYQNIDRENLNPSRIFFELKDLKLTSIPSDLLKYDIVKLDLSGNLITWIPTELCNQSNLTTLRIDRNLIEEIPECLGNLVTLRSLSLNRNRIKNFPDCLRRLINLQFLELHQNQIQEIPTWIGELQSLKGLDLQYNDIEEIPKSIHQLANLQSFYYNSNPIREVPDLHDPIHSKPYLPLIPDSLDIFGVPRHYDIPKRMEALLQDKACFFSNEIKKLYEEFKKDKDPEKGKELLEFLELRDYAIFWGKMGANVRYSTRDTIDDLKEKCKKIDKKKFREILSKKNKVDLRNAKLTSIPLDLFKYFKGKSLDLSKNLIIRIPEVLKDQQGLTHLDLKDNLIQEIPEFLGKLVNLECLDLSHNQIKQIPECLSNLFNLQELVLGYNMIQEIPESFGKLSKLETLKLHGNNIEKIPSCMTKLNKLTSLDIGSNPIKDFEIINAMSNLESLRLCYSEICEVPCLKDLTKLKFLYLYNNKIETIPEWIGFLTKLETLDLSFNKIKEIPETMKNLINLKKLDIVSNELEIIPSFLGELKKLNEIQITYNKIKKVPNNLKEKIDSHGYRNNPIEPEVKNHTSKPEGKNHTSQGGGGGCTVI